jgi:hypothetical protein
MSFFVARPVFISYIMSKRFIDSGIFDDDWFMDLSKDAKLLWVYFITKCDHAGILKLNDKLCKVQTDIKDLNGVIKQLGNRLVTVSEHLYFIPKFIEFQYPGFPNSKVRQQISAVDILVKYGLFDKEKQTVTKELSNTYEHVTVNDTVNVIVNEHEEIKVDFEIFWNLYGKKLGSKNDCKKKWDKLTLEEQNTIIEILPEYKNQFSDIQFQPYPETFINQRRWENDIIKPKNNLGVTPAFKLSEEDEKQHNELKRQLYETTL